MGTITQILAYAWTYTDPPLAESEIKSPGPAPLEDQTRNDATTTRLDGTATRKKAGMVNIPAFLLSIILDFYCSLIFLHMASWLLINHFTSVFTMAIVTIPIPAWTNAPIPNTSQFGSMLTPRILCPANIQPKYSPNIPIICPICVQSTIKIHPKYVPNMQKIMVPHLISNIVSCLIPYW